MGSNLDGAVNLKQPSKDRPPRVKRGIEPLKAVLEFLWRHSLREEGYVLHVVEIPLVC